MGNSELVAYIYRVDTDYIGYSARTAVAEVDFDILGYSNLAVDNLDSAVDNNLDNC